MTDAPVVPAYPVAQPSRAAATPVPQNSGVTYSSSSQTPLTFSVGSGPTFATPAGCASTYPMAKRAWGSSIATGQS